jgi:hypothetical protein
MLGPEYLPTYPRSIIRYPPTLTFGEPRNLELWFRLEFRSSLANRIPPRLLCRPRHS